MNIRGRINGVRFVKKGGSVWYTRNRLGLYIWWNGFLNRDAVQSLDVLFSTELLS